MRSRHSAALAVLGVFLASISVAAQWFTYPTAGVPRKADGSVNMSAPAPRMVDGKPDFSGIWMTGEPNRPTSGLSSPNNQAGPREAQTADDKPGDPTEIRASRQMSNIGVDLPGGLPYQPWLVPIVKERTANDAIDDPHIRCLPDNFLRAYGLPHLLKFVHTPSLLVVLNEMNAGYRQVFFGRTSFAEGSHAVVAGILVGEVVRRYPGDRHDWDPRRHVDRLERKRGHRGGPSAGGNPPP
jgi:hypothetical protein